MAQDICGTHTVIKGDTLRNIAKETYGSAKDYRHIFDANRRKFGISPHIVRVGLSLDLPCHGNFTTSETTDTSVETVASAVEPTETVGEEVVEQASTDEAEPETVAATPIPEVDTKAEPTSELMPETNVETIASVPIVLPAPKVVTDIGSLKLVGFSDNQPYSDAALLHGGLITTLIETALLRSEAARVGKPMFVTRTDHGRATDILPEDYHLSFPWLLPDCDLGEFDADINDLCENYTFSAPIYEAQMAMYTLSESPFKDAVNDMDLVGARICRPAAMHTYDLLEIGMIEPIISLETAQDLAACFDKLQNNIVDVVSVNGLTADVHFARVGPNAQIIELSNLVEVHTVHAITQNDNEDGLIALEYLNSGLWDMLANGEWGEISKDYLLNRLE